MGNLRTHSQVQKMISWGAKLPLHAEAISGALTGFAVSVLGQSTLGETDPSPRASTIED
jgi:hypothetical protein